jgi:ribonuclease H2 subunit B
MADGKLLVMTPMDPAFLLLRILQATQPVDGSTSQFRTTDDLIDVAAKHLSCSSDSENSPALQQDITEFFSLTCTKEALTSLCEMKEFSSEIVVYRYSQKKFVDYLRAKVAHLQKCPSFDESQTLTRNLAKEGLMEDGKEELLKLARMRACCDLVAQYLPSDTRDILLNSYDFARLQSHIEASKEQAIANLAAAPPKTKAKAEGKSTTVDKKRKAPRPSQGVEKLKKANTTGMAKLSNFFGKA